MAKRVFFLSTCDTKEKTTSRDSSFPAVQNASKIERDDVENV
jgi:hypothetical protein